MSDYDNMINDMIILITDMKDQIHAKDESDINKVILYKVITELGLAIGYADGAWNAK